MTWAYTPYAGILWASAVISAYIAYQLSRRRAKAGVVPLFFLMCAITEWAFASGLEAASIGLAQKLFWSKIKYLGALSAPLLYFVFALYFGHRTNWLTRRNIILLSLIPLAGFLTALTNEWHHLIWNSFTPSPVQPTVIIYGHGIGFYILVAYDYLLLFTGLLVLIRAWPRSPKPYRQQVVIILIGSFLPLVSGIIYILGLNPFPGLDITPVSFLSTGILLAVGINMHRLFDLVPIARDSLIENMMDGVLVLDIRNRIVDINPTAKKLISNPATEAIGQPVENVLKSWPNLMKSFRGLQEIQTELQISQTPPRYLDLHISPLYDRRKRFAGRLIVFRDVSERQQTGAELARKVEELNIINRISLAITSGLDMEHVLTTLHEQCNQVAPMDIFYVALYDEANSLIHVPLIFERGRYQAGPSRDIKDRPGVIGDVIQSRKTLYLKNTIKQETAPLQQQKSVLDKQARSYIGIPLTVRERIIGVMSIQSYRPEAYTDDQIHLLERVAVQAAIAIENSRLYAEVQRLAIIDELTGIYNFRGLLELGTREVERARRFNHPLSALFFDIDGFRKFNNTYSHSTGNIVLQTMIKSCHNVLRSVDILTRYGGDEFVALLPETDLASAETIAHRLAEEIAATKIATPYGSLKVTVSIGIALLTSDTSDLAALIESANLAEHQAKQNHKGIVTIAS